MDEKVIKMYKNAMYKMKVKTQKNAELFNLIKNITCMNFALITLYAEMKNLVGVRLQANMHCKTVIIMRS